MRRILTCENTERKSGCEKSGCQNTGTRQYMSMGT
jgi:hypothetical protein